MTEAEAAIDTLAPVAIEAEATIQMLAPVATRRKSGIQTSALVASSPAATEFPTPLVTEAEAVIETLAPIVSEADATIESRVDEFLTRPEAEAVHKSEAEVADTPLTPPVDILISDENHARALLDAASDNAAVDDDAVYEAPAIGELVDDAAVPAELPAAAPHPQDDINVVAEIPEHKDEAARAVAVELAARPQSSKPRARLLPSKRARPQLLRRGGQEPPTSRVIALQRRKSDRRRSEAASASERSARRALRAERRGTDRVVQLQRLS